MWGQEEEEEEETPVASVRGALEKLTFHAAAWGEARVTASCPQLYIVLYYQYVLVPTTNYYYYYYYLTKKGGNRHFLRLPFRKPHPWRKVSHELAPISGLLLNGFALAIKGGVGFPPSNQPEGDRVMKMYYIPY